MRILCFNWRDLANPASGGAEVFTEEVLRRWVAWGHAVTLFTSHVGSLPRRDMVEGVEVVRSGTKLGVYREARRFWRHEGHRFDVVLDEINTRPFGTPNFVHGKPIVALIHQLAADVWRQELSRPAAYVGERWLEPRWLRRYADIPCMTVSASSAESIRQFGLQDVTIVPEGMSPYNLDPVPPRSDVPTAVFLGRLTRNKRPDHAMVAFRIARRAVPTARLWVIGGGPMLQELQGSAGEGVTLLGRLTEEHKAQRLAEANVLLATSIREGWGLNVSEAAWFGTPTIGYRVPGLVDSIPASGGHLVDPTPAALANALVEHWEGRLVLSARPSTLPWDDVARHCLKVVEHVYGGGKASDVPPHLA